MPRNWGTQEVYGDTVWAAAGSYVVLAGTMYVLLCHWAHNRRVLSVWEGLKLTPALPAGELLRWLEQRQLLHALAADTDPAPDPDLQLPPQAPKRRRRRRSGATNSVHRCCLTGCTRQDLLRLCPH